MDVADQAESTIQDRSSRYTIAIAMVAGLGGLMFGYDIGVIADAKIGVTKAFSLSTGEIAMVVSAVTAGSFLGALIAGRLCDAIGRRWTNVWGGICFIIGCLGCAMSFGLPMIVAFRVMMGIGVGFSSVAGPLYIAEVSTPWSRGAMVSLYQLAITVGIFVAFLVGLLLDPDTQWRISFGIGALLGGALIAGMLVMPPSPRWLIGRGRFDVARGVLQRTLGSDKEADRELAAIKQRVAEESGVNFRAAIKSSHAVRLALILAIGLALLQQASGINAIFYYAPEILEDIGLGDRKLLLTAALGLVNVLATFIAIWLVDRVGRRRLLLGGTALMMASQIVIGITGSMLASNDDSGVSVGGIVILVSIFVAITAFAFSLGPLVWLVISEIFPAGVRSACVGVATSFNWLGNYLIALGTPWAIDQSPSLAFWIFAICNAVTILFVYFRMPETKGVPLEDIEAFFDRKPSSPRDSGAAN